MPDAGRFDRLVRHWPIAAVIGLTCILYTYRLEYSPPYLGGDEAHFGVQGHALAQDGRTLNGVRLPLFVNLWDPLADQDEKNLRGRWYQPMLFYLTALSVAVAPLSETSLRWPMAVIAGGLTPWLLYAVAWQIFRRRDAAVLAAVLLALSPSNLILGRQALDYLLPVPFVVGWLWCLTGYLESGGRGRLFGGGLLLGFGFYSYIAAWVFMPLCLGITVVVLARAERSWGRAALTTAAGFAIALLPLLPWLVSHPDMLSDTLRRYESTGGGARAMESLAAPLVNYASIFNPWLLFVTGGPVPTTSLGRAGVFLLPVAVLFPIGVVALLRRGAQAGMSLVILLGVVLAPAPLIAAREPHMIQRVMFLLPFVILAACAGFQWLRESPARGARIAALVLVAAVPVQFAYVYFDYFTHYRQRAAFYYDPVAFRDVATFILEAAESGPVPQVLLDRNLDDPGAKWRFYTTVHGRQDLLPRTRYVDVDDKSLDTAGPGSLLVTYDAAAPLKALLETGRWTVVRQVHDVDARLAALILRRTADR